jgi:hypothetical protein
MPRAPRPSSKADLADADLAKKAGKRIKVFLTSGVCLTGKLLKHDKKTLVLEDEKDSAEGVPVTRSHITMIRIARKGE